MNLTLRDVTGTMRNIDALPEQTLLEVLQDDGEATFAPCGGNGTCGRCRILVRDANGVKHRLACQTKAFDGIEIMLEDLGTMSITRTLPDEASQSHSSISQKHSEGVAAHPALPAGGSYGLAVDIGTTTMVFHLVNLATKEIVCTLGKVNPQVVFGGDVIARITASSLPGKLDAMCAMIRRSIDEARTELCQHASINKASVQRIAIVGNTVMEHFAAGLDPTTIGIAPFAPLSLFGCKMNLAQIDGSSQQAYLAPAVAGYVGGDITAGLHVSGMEESEKLQLFIDIGTNGEMALGNRSRIACCATAAGPAFEGAGIAFGMPALAGAICSVSIEQTKFVTQTIADAPPLGICGSGLMDAVSCLLELGLVDEAGRFCEKGEVDEQLGTLLGVKNEQTICYLDEPQGVFITQKDIRNVQLAKAAIRAGIDTLLAELHANYEDIEKVFLAGGFGAHISVTSIVRIGLLPGALEKKTSSMGNAAGTGAVDALTPSGQAALESIASKCEYVELSTNSKFSEFYLDALGFE